MACGMRGSWALGRSLCESRDLQLCTPVQARSVGPVGDKACGHKPSELFWTDRQCSSDSDLQAVKEEIANATEAKKVSVPFVNSVRTDRQCSSDEGI